MKKSLIIIATLIFFNIKAQQTICFVSLKDGSGYRGITNQGNLIMTTKYGTLNIPASDISSLNLALHTNQKEKTKVYDLIKKIDVKDSIGVYKIIDQLKSRGAEATMYFKEYVNEHEDASEAQTKTFNNLFKLFPIIDSDLLSNDQISTNTGLTINGDVKFDSIILTNSLSSGKIVIPRNAIERIEFDVLDIHSVFSSGANNNTYILEAHKHIFGNLEGGWLKTNILVKKGQNLNIISSGEITLASLNNRKFSPDGTKAATENTADATYPTYGSLIYKIGKEGKEIKAGKNYTAVANEEGYIYLSIYETLFDKKNKGKYSVKVTVN